MLVGAAVLAFLVLLAVLAERAGSRLWDGGRLGALVCCRRCDLRYPPGDRADPVRICPRGHTIEVAPREFPFGTVAMGACVGVIAGVAALILTGVVPVP